MNDSQRKEILAKGKIFFKEHIAENHIKNSKKLRNLNEFNVNPFLDKYLANFAFGDDTSENIAKALLYPRILGTSINTTFGTQLQFFCNEVLDGYASMVSGIDIEFIDCIDGRKKYCQIKAGPNTINHDDVKTIIDHFNAVKNLARTNRNLDINPSTDCIVGVFYGEKDDLSASYRKINQDYAVICGREFWHRLTGDSNFYAELINAFAEVAVEMDSRELIEEILESLSEQISENR
ncbi:MAG: PmeII family type II restriction endonuclease [Anaerovoracaceae bacterium]